ncbi:branched-chain amino acid aminotransferase [Acidipropionibacterium jensenii]|uniref:Branched-chain-amino-acid aminotransferase n=1 Tax=Acidipropionibacterium jensenii TaxID=1749 RepID=A0A3Q9UDM8_9ACTN|nr:branched-chain amino acid aminotransferase [Acidipropionibacterium jensenii]AZZ39245.1 branched-chain amino acid aminotransferase [Acidipropionibacterium jensenii]AZZ42343.1 branched-chain amino acid aminotransferase [Acidipropionibacterium jensenii]
MSLSFAAPDDLTWSPDDAIAALHADPKFGVAFTDHMAEAIWTADGGWHDDAVAPYGPLDVNPASAVLHYAQEIFEGLKAYRHADGSVWLFRPDCNAERFANSARRLALPVLPEEDFVTSCLQIAETEARWVPDAGKNGEKSLYLRPFMIAYEDFLGVAPAKRVLYSVICSPVGPYFSGGVSAVRIWLERHNSRTAPGGTGAAKCGGNYAASLLAQEEAYAKGCSQVLFADAVEHAWVEELGGMNIFAVTKDKEIVTPVLTGTILPGVTRRSILGMAPDLGLTPVERRLGVDELLDGIRSGEFPEVFACGTAAVVTPIGSLVDESGETTVKEQAGEVTMAIRNRLLDIQYGRVEDIHGWLRRVC